MDDGPEHPNTPQDHYFSDVATAELADLCALDGFLLENGHDFMQRPSSSSEIDTAALVPNQRTDDPKIVEGRVPGENVSTEKKGETNNGVGRVSFRTKSEQDVMEDGYKWRKYGKKSVKSSPHPRNYYKCMSEGCKVKKRVERDRYDSSYVVTTYEGIHDHGSHLPLAGEARAKYEDRSSF